MAHILIQSQTDPAHVIRVVHDRVRDHHFGHCPRCREDITDRGAFEDTVEAIRVHVDHMCVSHGSGA